MFADFLRVNPRRPCQPRTISSHFREVSNIPNYFIDRHTSGFVEGLNNKINVITRRCYGILNIKHVFQRIHLDLEGYALYV